MGDRGNEFSFFIGIRVRIAVRIDISISIWFVITKFGKQPHLIYQSWTWNYIGKITFYRICKISWSYWWQFKLGKNVNDLSQTNTRYEILSKIRNDVNKGTLRTVYFAIFHSYINYIPIACGNTKYPKQSIPLLQKKTLRIMHFAQFNSHTSPSFYNSNKLKFIDIIYTESCVFINNCFNEDSFTIFCSELQFMLKYPLLQYRILE